MDELNAMREMQQEAYEKSLETDRLAYEIEERKKRQLSELIKISVIAICCILLIVFIYNLIVHPLDRIKLKMATYNNYSVTISIPGAGVKQTIEVDGNIIYTNGTYYEVVGNDVYVFKKNIFGNWKKEIVSEDVDPSSETWLTSLLDKENYTHNVFTGRLDYKGDFCFDEIEVHNLRTKVMFGMLSATGSISKGFGHYNLKIEIDNFGLIKLTPPEVFKK